MKRLIVTLFALILLGWGSSGWGSPAMAQVQVAFHSFNGSVMGGRFPHTFIALSGTLRSNGKRINENYGFTAKKISPAILDGPVKHAVMSEKRKYLTTTNVHFKVTISDAQYHRIKAEMRAWKRAPGKYYDLDTRNCIHFVGKMAQISGLKVTYPQSMLHRPKRWLNHIAKINPKLGAKPI